MKRLLCLVAAIGLISAGCSALAEDTTTTSQITALDAAAFDDVSKAIEVALPAAISETARRERTLAFYEHVGCPWIEELLLVDPDTQTADDLIGILRTLMDQATGKEFGRETPTNADWLAMSGVWLDLFLEDEQRILAACEVFYVIG